MTMRMTKERLNFIEEYFTTPWSPPDPHPHPRAHERVVEACREIRECWKEREKDREAMELAEKVLVYLMSEGLPVPLYHRLEEVTALDALRARLEEK